MRLINLIRTTFQRFMDHDCMSSAASIAYFTIFSMPPLVVVLLTIADAFGFSKGEVDRLVFEKLGVPTAQFGASDVGKSVNDRPPSTQSNDQRQSPFGTSFGSIIQLGFASKVIGIVILLVSALAIFAQLQDVLNRIWQVAPDRTVGWVRSFLMKRLLSMGMVFLIWVILLVSLVFTAMIDVVLEFINGTTPGFVARLAGTLINEGATFSVATLMFASIFKILPDAKMRWQDVWVGSAVTAVMFVIGKVLVGQYLKACQVGSDWGTSAASTAAALVWVYYSALIVLLGAEFTQVWATRDGHVAEPSAGALHTQQVKLTIPAHSVGSTATPSINHL